MKPAVRGPARRLLIAVTAALAMLAIPATGAAVFDPLVPPTLLSPADGAQIVAATPVVFDIQTSPDDPGGFLWLHVSRSPAVDATGVIDSDADIEPFTAVAGQPGVFRAAPTYYSFPSFWMNSPGTYYWQAFRINCSGSLADCYIQSPIRTLVITPRPVTASITSIGPARACYRSRSSVRVHAAGFAPGASVELRFSGSYAASTTADALGNVSTTVAVPSAGIGPVQRRFALSVAERNFPQNTAKVSVLAANLDFTATPSYFVRRGQKVQFRFSGMVTSRGVYAHYRLGGRTRANVRLGAARGACGMLTVRAPMIPSAITRAGTWLVQFDALRGYSPSAAPQLRATIRVRSIFL